MEILLGNDDGIHARGLRILYELVAASGHKPYIVAPEHQASGTSHAITLHTPLIPRPIYSEGKLYGLAVNGLPADAIKLGISAIYPDVDVVMTGINAGHNAGPAACYSGTLAAAFEGFMAGKPALAFSFDAFNEDKMDGLKETLLPLMPQFLALCHTPHVYNINIPCVAKVKGIKLTRHYLGFYLDHYEKHCDPRGRDYYWLKGLGYAPERPDAPGRYPNDLETLNKGYITITPLQYDWTEYELLDKVAQDMEKHAGEKKPKHQPR
jgi:5'-nucleotidase